MLISLKRNQYDGIMRFSDPQGTYQQSGGVVVPYTYTITHYISPTGGDTQAAFGAATNPASPCSYFAFKTYAQPGHFALAAPGVYVGSQSWLQNQSDWRWESVFTFDNSGTAGNPIGVVSQYPAAYHHANPSLRTEFRTWTSTDNGGAGTIGSFGRNYHIFDGIYIDENVSAKWTEKAPILVKDSDNVTIRRCYVRSDTLPGGPQDNHSAIRGEDSSNLTIEDGVYTNCYLLTSDPNTDVGDSHAHTMLFYGCDNVEIRYNTIHSARGGIHFKGERVDDQRNPMSVHHNRIYDLDYSGIMLGEVESSVSQFCDIYQNIVSNVERFVHFVPYTTNLPREFRLINNSFYNASTTEGALFASAGAGAGTFQNSVIRNNIFHINNTNTNLLMAYSDLTETIVRRADWGNNVYHGHNATLLSLPGASHTLSTWQALGEDAGSISQDPLFADAANSDFSLQGSSPAINKGADYLNLLGGGTSAVINAGAHISGSDHFGPRAAA
ncbi:MAG: hypothetical protein AB2797_13760 [Candidatus Thiodiazotropha sp.]